MWRLWRLWRPRRLRWLRHLRWLWRRLRHLWRLRRLRQLRRLRRLRDLRWLEQRDKGIDRPEGALKHVRWDMAQRCLLPDPFRPECDGVQQLRDANLPHRVRVPRVVHARSLCRRLQRRALRQPVRQTVVVGCSGERMAETRSLALREQLLRQRPLLLELRAVGVGAVRGQAGAPCWKGAAGLLTSRLSASALVLYLILSLGRALACGLQPQVMRLRRAALVARLRRWQRPARGWRGSGWLHCTRCWHCGNDRSGAQNCSCHLLRTRLLQRHRRGRSLAVPTASGQAPF